MRAASISSAIIPVKPEPADSLISIEIRATRGVYSAEVNFPECLKRYISLER